MTSTAQERATGAESAAGTVAGLYITDAAGQPMRALQSAIAVAGAGLAGDRYLLGTGFYSDGQSGRQLTLIEAEDLERMERETGVRLDPLECRRNIVTRGVALAPLIGRRFRVGAVLCEGVRACPPCNHLEELTRPGPLRGLARSGGIRAHILTGGEISLGDAVAPVE